MHYQEPKFAYAVISTFKKRISDGDMSYEVPDSSTVFFVTKAEALAYLDQQAEDRVTTRTYYISKLLSRHVSKVSVQVEEVLSDEN